MILMINGKETKLEGVQTLEDVVKTLGYKGDYFAVAVNMNCVPRSLHSSTPVKEWDAVEILSPMQGG